MAVSASSPIILVHGSWLGGWCWRPVQAALAKHGHASEAITLTGLGDRHHLGSPDTGLVSHVRDLLAHLDFADGDTVTLVGHSYGGLVAAEAAALRPDRVAQLVVMDGFVGEAGKSIFDSYPALAGAFAALEDPANPGMVAPPGPDFLGIPEGPEFARVIERLRPMALATHAEPARHTAHELVCTKRYVRFAQFPIFEATFDAARANGWRASVIDAGHMAVVTNPAAVALNIVEGIG